MEIRRDAYLEKFKIRMHNGFIKVITGIRRSGKSYLLNKIFYQWLLSSGIDKQHIIKFAFDSSDDLELIGENSFDIDFTERNVDPQKFTSYIKSRITDNGRYYLLLDEIQKLGAFETVLNGYLRKENLDVYVTGSNSKFLSSDILTEFEGRGDEIHVFPLTFSEFFSVFSGTKEEAFENYMIYGGLPAVASMVTNEQKNSYLTTQLNNVYLKDIIVRNNLRREKELEELLDVLASGISCLTNPKKLENSFLSIKNKKISDNTIDKYIDYLTEAFIISKANRYDVKGRHYIGSPYKIYFEDIGLRNARIGFRQIEETHIIENIIYNELRSRGFNVDTGTVESRETDENGKSGRKYYEIDFVAVSGSKKYYIQSAYDIPDREKWEQETKPLRKTRDSFKKIVIVKNPVVARYDESGCAIVGIYEFLLNKDSLEI